MQGTDKSWLPAEKLIQIDLTADGVNTANARVKTEKAKKGIARIISFNRRRKVKKKKKMSRTFSVAGRRRG